MIHLGAQDLMLALNGPIRDRPGWVYEFKLDGFRTVVSKQGKAVRCMSRNGKDATLWYPELAHALSVVPGNFVIDGEVCVLDHRGVPDFEQMRVAVASKRRNGYVLFAFDLLYAGRRDLRERPLQARKERLEALLGGRSPPLHVVSHIVGEGQATFEYAVQIGMEGVVAKRADSPYRAGRGSDWIKTKPAGVHEGWKRPLRHGTQMASARN